MKIPARVRNPKPWVSTISLLLFVLHTYFKIDVPYSDVLVNMILVTAGTWGIWKNWNDDESELNIPNVVNTPGKPVVPYTPIVTMVPAKEGESK